MIDPRGRGAWFIASVVFVAPLGCGGGSPVAQPQAIAVEKPTNHADTDTFDGSPVELALGHNQTCIRLEGKVHCATALSPSRPLGSLRPVAGIDDAVSLALGQGFGCAVTRPGLVKCFGANSRGQLGALMRDEATGAGVTVADVDGAVKVVAGRDHACALLRDGTVRCWGENRFGQTGADTYYMPAARELVHATPVPSVSGVTSLAAGSRTTCARVGTGELYCWGAPTASATGGGRSGTLPAPVPLLGKVDRIAASDENFCAIKSGEVWCWSDMNGRAPSAVGVSSARRLAVGMMHACAVLQSGEVTCWGRDDGGALGRPSKRMLEEAPEVVPGLPRATEVAATFGVTCAVTGARSVHCWGRVGTNGAPGAPSTSPIELRL